MLTWSDMCGVTGVAVSTTCYACVQWRRDFAKSIHYSLLNLVATVLFAISILQDWNLAAFINNTLWGVISLYGVYRCLKYMRRKPSC